MTIDLIVGITVFAYVETEFTHAAATKLAYELTKSMREPINVKLCCFVPVDNLKFILRRQRRYSRLQAELLMYTLPKE